MWALGGKRAFDVLVSLALLLVLSPFLLLIAALVKATSRGPVFFSQGRAGRDGKLFRVYKFRTMLGGRRPDPKELVPLDHPEITPLGRVLRRTKIDELPQLYNVLRGDMSLVGPRPTLPDQAAAYDALRRQRLLVRPGVTGLAQVNGNSMTAWDERILYDIAYVRRCGLVMDLGILLRTLAVLVLGEQRMTRPFETTRYARYVTPPSDFSLRAVPASPGRTHS
ncbi:MAG: sugar transferase [Planctomycetes bacterium]|nr:sugar transferase [Planctomycetota bacterium]